MSFTYYFREVFDEKGRQIKEIMPRSGEPPEDFKPFMVDRTLSHQQTGQPLARIQMPIDAIDVDDAFEKLEATEKLADAQMIENFKHETAKQKILLPSQVANAQAANSMNRKNGFHPRITG